MQEVEWNMASKRTLTVVAGVGAAALAIAGVAIAQNHEANENRIIGKHSERDIPLAQVPEAAMNAARAQLASISKAEQVTRKADGSTLYEIKGKNSDGKTIELFVTPEGRVLVNEVSPRVHNAGHYTLEATESSQFEQHLRAVLDLPLGATEDRVLGALKHDGERAGDAVPDSAPSLSLSWWISPDMTR